MQINVKPSPLAVFGGTMCDYELPEEFLQAEREAKESGYIENLKGRFIDTESLEKWSEFYSYAVYFKTKVGQDSYIKLEKEMHKRYLDRGL